MLKTSPRIPQKKHQQKTFSLMVLATIFFLQVPISAQTASIFSSLDNKKNKLQPATPTPYSYTVNIHLDGDNNKSFFSSYSHLYNSENKNADNPINLILTARDDYKNLLAALYDRAYYSGTIEILLNGHEVTQYPLTSTIPLKNQIDIFIKTGPKFHFDKISIYPPLPTVAAQKKLSNIFETIGYVPNDPAYAPLIDKASLALLQQWQRLGYALAHVYTTQTIANHVTEQISSTLGVRLGPIAHYGPVKLNNVSKNPYMDPNFIIWMLNLPPGKIYNPDDIIRAQNRLNRLQVFNASTISLPQHLDKNNLLPLTLTVDESPLRRIGLGANYTSLNGFGVETYWQHRNLFGRAESLKLTLNVGQISRTNLTPKWKSDSTASLKNLSYNIGATFNKPGVYTPDTNFLISVKAARSVLNTYLQNSVSTQIGFSHAFTPYLIGSVYASGARTQTYDNYYGERNFLWFGPEAQLTFDNRNNITNPTTGFYLSTSVTPFYVFNLQQLIERFTLEGRTYLPLNNKKSVILAARVLTGSIFNTSTANIPPDMVFFTGGGDSIRGYAYRNIGIKTETGDIIGGRSLFVTSLELRSFIGQQFGLVAFVDMGAVSNSTFPTLNRHMAIGTGIGIRYITPVGPMRFDVAVPINRTNRDPRIGVYVGIGQAF